MSAQSEMRTPGDVVLNDLPPGWRWDESEVVLSRRYPDGAHLRITTEVAVPCSCDGGWVEDEGWSAYEHGLPAKERRPEDGLLPCGFCNHGGWDAPWPVDASGGRRCCDCGQTKPESEMEHLPEGWVCRAICDPEEAADFGRSGA